MSTASTERALFALMSAVGAPPWLWMSLAGLAACVGCLGAARWQLAIALAAVAGTGALSAVATPLPRSARPPAPVAARESGQRPRRRSSLRAMSDHTSGRLSRRAGPRGAAFLGLCLLALPTAARAARETHDGFFGRLQAGFGYTRMTSTPLTIQGEGTLLNVALGASLNEHLGVFGELSQTMIFAPSFHPNGDYADDDDGVSTRLSGLGAGATWYFLPTNLYVSGTVRMLMASVQVMHDRDADVRFRTDFGYGLNLSFGKEWWVDDEWGLGAAATAQLSRIPDQDDTTWHNGTFGLALSATFN